MLLARAVPQGKNFSWRNEEGSRNYYLTNIPTFAFSLQNSRAATCWTTVRCCWRL